MAEVFYGLGRHKHFLSTYQQSRFLKFDFLDWIQVFITLALMKISILLFLLRLSKFAHLRRFLIFLIVFIILTHLPLTILMVTQCQPVYKYWLQDVPGTCWSKKTREYIVIAQGGMSWDTQAFFSAKEYQWFPSSRTLSGPRFPLFYSGTSTSGCAVRLHYAF